MLWLKYWRWQVCGNKIRWCPRILQSSGSLGKVQTLHWKVEPLPLLHPSTSSPASKPTPVKDAFDDFVTVANFYQIPPQDIKAILNTVSGNGFYSLNIVPPYLRSILEQSCNKFVWNQSFLWNKYFTGIIS